jgi:hypothetical protein
VAEVGVHDDDKVALGELQAVDVCGSETELSCSRLEDDSVCAPDLLELFRDVLGAVRRAIVYDDDFPVEIAVR